MIYLQCALYMKRLLFFHHFVSKTNFYLLIRESPPVSKAYTTALQIASFFSGTMLSCSRHQSLKLITAFISLSPISFLACFGCTDFSTKEPVIPSDILDISPAHHLPTTHHHHHHLNPSPLTSIQIYYGVWIPSL